MKQTTPDIQDIAHWFLTKEPVTHKKLQKLCYYAVAWGHALMDKNIAKRSRFEAWVHGPVSPVINKEYVGNGWNDLPMHKGALELPGDIEELLESVWLTYGDKSGNELEALSHSERPWLEARAGLPDSQSSKNRINPDTMRKFYLSIKL